MRKHYLLLFIFSLLTFSFASAQNVTTSSMSGTVVDEKGLPLPGVTITAIHTPTGTNYATVSRGDGRFNLPNIRVGGPYTISFRFIGYNPYVQNNITLSLGEDFKVNAKIAPNNTELKEVVISGTQNKVINNSRTGSQEVVTRAQIDRLPTITRSISDYTKLTPTAAGNGSFGGRNGNGNNLTVDGALFNNSFGLANSLGGQANSQPISLDAIEQIQVSVSPFDVTQGRFAGTGINTVTKSGTNEFKGSVYYYKRSAGLVGLDAGTATVLKPTINYSQRGISLGGPIIKNKLFFFVSGEQERIKDPATSLTAARDGQTGGVGSISRATYNDLNTLKEFLKTKYGYDAGAFENYQLRTQSDKIAAKLDWNIDKNNTLSVKYFYLKSFRDVPPSGSGSPSPGRSASSEGLPFFSSYYTINNNFNIGIAELNTRIGSKFANKLTVGYQALRDFRASPGGGSFPLVDIQNPSGTTMTSFGYEPFTANNVLNTNTFQLSDNFTIYAGKHEFNLGVAYESNKFKNGFAPNYYGGYRFKSLQDFYDSANNGATTATRYDFRYSALPDGSFPFAIVKSYTASVYAQDKWNVNDNFKLTYGVRVDMPVYNTDSQFNSNAANLTLFRDGYQINTAQFPKTRIQLSPRVGFNWDVTGESTTQLRGGVGVFAGPVPYVYISNQASNNGVQFGSYSISPGSGGVLATDPRLAFNPNVNANRPTGAAANTSYNLVVTDKNFKLPSNFRANLAVDQKLPFGIIGTIEGIYSKDINSVYFVNLALPTAGTAFNGPDNRIRYSGTTVYPSIPAAQGGNTAANPNITDAILLKNSSKGYTYSVTGQLQRTWKELYFNIAYTHSDARTVNDGGSIAQSTWRDRSVSGDPNDNVTSYANFYQPNRVIASFSYRKDYIKHLTTSIGLTYEAANNGVASYVYNGDMNGDGQTTNDLIYIPKSSADIVLIADNAADLRTGTKTLLNPNGSETGGALYAQLSNYINQDPYLSKHKGQYSKRNGLTLPYFHLVNFNFTQDLYATTGKVKNTLQFEFNIINLGNFLNSAWGNFKFVNRTTLLSYKGIYKNAADASDPNNGKPLFSFPYLDNSNQIPLTSTFGNGVSQVSRWQAQLGLRYIFN